jgi:hypothetical protein
MFSYRQGTACHALLNPWKKTFENLYIFWLLPKLFSILAPKSAAAALPKN